MKITEHLRTELKLIGEHQTVAKGYKKWLLGNGLTFKNINKDLSKQVSQRIMARIKSCYYNTWSAISYEDLELKYFEGFVYSKTVPIPIEHGFAVTSDGQVIDPTLAISGKELASQMKKIDPQRYYKARDRLGQDQFGDEYFGIEIPLEFVNHRILKEKQMTPSLFSYYLKEAERQQGRLR